MKKNIYNVFRAIILFGACVGFTYASYNLTKSYLGYKNADAAYAEIDEMFLQPRVSEEDEIQETDTDDKEETKEIGYSASVAEWVWDYEAMLEYNPEAIGYIKLEDSRIQYPILQHSDNDYYLNHGSNRIYNGNGAIFVDARIQGGLDARSSIVYGHDMMDGSMFAGLLKFRKDDFCKSHQVFDIYVGYKHYRYYVFASFVADANDEKIYKMGFQDDKEYSEWISRCMSKSGYKYDVEKPTTDDNTLLLSTCLDNDGGRYVVALVRGEEVVD